MCSRYELPANTPEMRAWDPAEDERRRREANNLGIMFLGPVFGAPAALARMAGAPEPVVESMGQLGLDMAGVAGVPGARGGGRVIEPVPMRPVATAPRNLARDGVVIQKTPPKTINPRLLASRQGPSEMSKSKVDRLAKKMKKDGFDPSKPIEVADADGKNIIINGHHRAEAAIKAGIKEVPIDIAVVSPGEAAVLRAQVQDATAERVLKSFP